MFALIDDSYLPAESKDSEADAVWLTESSGGFLYRIENPNMLLDAAQDIAFEIENYVAVRFTVPAIEKEASLRLEAVDPSGRKRKNIELRFPEKLIPCASLSSKQ